MEGIFSRFEALIGRLERRSKLQLQLQQLDPNDPERQEVAAKLLGLRAETAAGWNAAVDWAARYAGVLQALTAAQDGAIFEALTEPDAKKMMKKLRLLVRWEVTRRMVQKRVDSS
ncbi:hypothetical protein COHA_010779 [Chlorella ohadii]|uniref:Uncharacterized protein n=1 Tax=Chlorella ohadii TaxID=2649997 RepID=A0AAD5DH28_9CHLO|nr:hypothetical protein COHA_010779 [Chlorella ohadii]